MAKGVMNVVKGVALGMAAGAAVGMVGKKLMSGNKKSMKKKANRALREVSNMIDTASYMFK